MTSTPLFSSLPSGVHGRLQKGAPQVRKCRTAGSLFGLCGFLWHVVTFNDLKV